MFSRWRKFERRSHCGFARQPRNASRPSLECLEDRVVPTFGFGTPLDLGGYDPQGIAIADLTGSDVFSVKTF